MSKLHRSCFWPKPSSSSSSSFRKLPLPCRPLHHLAMSSSPFLHAIATLNHLISSSPPPPPPDLSPSQASARRHARFQRLFDYVQFLEMEEPLSRLSVIHVAGTKGKGSTCAFTESILRSCGYRTGLFTSPHLVDVRERFRFNGAEVSEEVFAKHFWWCWDRLQARTDASLPMPGFFPFLTLLAIRMFTAENVDVAILEVGLGGRFDATNIVKNPVVCGITSLGFDHMEILGNTLAEIAREKAGIFKQGVPAFSVPQQPEAMDVLHEEAKRLSVSLEISKSLHSYSVDTLRLGLEGDHQRVNAALAVALCTSWAKNCGSKMHLSILEEGCLPDAYLHGLATTSWPGRAQVVHDMTLKYGGVNGEADRSLHKGGQLTYYLDGAHSPESMDACANWFCYAVALEEARNKKENCIGNCEHLVSHGIHCQTKNGYSAESLKEVLHSQRVLLFNCMPKRDPELLLPPLIEVCEQKGFHINMAIFVPPFSSIRSIDTRSVADIYRSTMETQPDLSWQKLLQQRWESLQQGQHRGSSLGMKPPPELTELRESMNGNQHLFRECSFGPSSAVMPSLPAAINWLRCCASGNHVQIQVLVTGSLYLVGDLLKILQENQDQGSWCNTYS